LAVLGVWFLLGLTQVTTSHIGVFSGSVDERVTTLFGEPRNIRSDEFLRNTPLTLSAFSAENSDWSTPLELANSEKFRHSGFEKVVDTLLLTPDNLLSALLRWVLPVGGQFAIIWWSSTALFVAAFVLWTREVGGGLLVGLLGAFAIFWIPLNQWFSYLPTLLIGNALASALLALLASRLLAYRAQTTGAVVAKWLALAAMLWWALSFAYVCLRYPPWGIPIALVVVAISLPELVSRLSQLGRRQGLVVASLASTVVALFVLRQLLGQAELIDAILATEYPGQRRSAGAGADVPQFLGGAATWLMQMPEHRHSGAVSPEMAFAPAALILVPVVALVKRLSVSNSGVGRHAWALAAGTGAALLVGVWGSSAVPSLLTRFNPLALVPGTRALQVFGVLAVVVAILSSILLKASPRRPPSIVMVESIVIGAVVYLISARATDIVRLELFGDSRRWISVVSVGAVCVTAALMCSVSARWVGLVALAVLLFLSSMLVNPVIVGIGPLGESDAVRTIQELSEGSPQGRWATSGFFEDALMIASGVPQLTGQQHSAPNYEAWRSIDPEEAFVGVWNRGQSYVNIQFDPGLDFSIWNPSPDVIQIVAQPCDRRFEELSLGFIVSARMLSNECAQAIATVQWMSTDLFIYRYLPTGI
jgi:hypothetical protein